MKLTRRDFLKGGAVTAAALAVGLKPKAPGGYVTEMLAVDSPGCILPEGCYDSFMASIHRSVKWECAHPWPSPYTWTVSVTEAYQEYTDRHGRQPETDDERREAYLVATLNRLDATHHTEQITLADLETMLRNFAPPQPINDSLVSLSSIVYGWEECDLDFLLCGGHDLQPIGILGPPGHEV